MSTDRWPLEHGVSSGSGVKPRRACPSRRAGQGPFQPSRGLRRGGEWTASFVDFSGLAPGGGRSDASLVELFWCTFDSDQLLGTSDFEVSVIGAVDSDRAPLDPLPMVTVSGVEQIGPLKTTTTEFAADAPVYDVTAGVISESGRLGALRFDINAVAIAGGWVGAGGSVSCSFDVDASLSQCNDEGATRLTCALVDVAGFDTPASIVACRFATRARASPQDFVTVVRDGSDESLGAVNVEMAVVDVRLH